MACSSKHCSWKLNIVLKCLRRVTPSRRLFRLGSQFRWVVPKYLRELRGRLLVWATRSPLSTMHFIVTSDPRKEYLWRSKLFNHSSFFVNCSDVTEVCITFFFYLLCNVYSIYLCGTSVWNLNKPSTYLGFNLIYHLFRKYWILFTI